MAASQTQEKTHENGTRPERAFHRTNVLPPLDVYESAEELLVVIDIPGVTADALNVSVEGDVLKFEARPVFHGPEASRPPASLFGATTYERQLKIPAGIDAARISAETKNGTVVLHMPKQEAARPRRIPVKGG
jgi:HSP20 family protein